MPLFTASITCCPCPHGPDCMSHQTSSVLSKNLCMLLGITSFIFPLNLSGPSFFCCNTDSKYERTLALKRLYSTATVCVEVSFASKSSSDNTRSSGGNLCYFAFISSNPLISSESFEFFAFSTSRAAFSPATSDASCVDFPFSCSFRSATSFSFSFSFF